MEDFINIHFNGQLELYASKIYEYEDYNIITSDLIEDQYWNLGYLKKPHIDFDTTWKKIKDEMDIIPRIPVIYITSNIHINNLEESLKRNSLKELYKDVWMTYEKLDTFEDYKSNIDFSIHKVDKKLQDKFIKNIMDGFSSDNSDEPYGELSNGYKIALERNFKKQANKYKSLHYLGMYNDEPVSTATIIYHEKKAIIYNITTSKQYRRHGICKKMMSHIMKELDNLEIKTVCLQTEKGFYTEKVYKSMGFKERITGIAYT